MSEQIQSHVLIVEARFYDSYSDGLLDGAITKLKEANVSYDVITVPGALEVPAAIALAAEGRKHYDGYIALGCVIRGETYHFDLVSNESARGLTDLSIKEQLAIGNGILTVENDEQAAIRSDKNQKDKGGFAATACLTMIKLKNKLQ